MIEDIITGLSRIRWLFVIARNSTFTYKGRAIDVKQVGRELGVRYVLEGSVRKIGERVRISGQLIDATTGAHVWAERYDRKVDDIFALQDEITLSVVGAIEPSLRRAEADRVNRKRSDSLDAYDLVLRSQADTFTRMPEAAKRALVLLERALALDPTYALAHAVCDAVPPHHFFARWPERGTPGSVDPPCRGRYCVRSRRCPCAFVCGLHHRHGQARPCCRFRCLRCCAGRKPVICDHLFSRQHSSDMGWRN